MAFHGPQPSGECVLLGIPKGHPSRDRPGVWEESVCLTSFQIWPPHRNLWSEEWIVIWGCIKTNLAIFGGMNIHLPVIWGSLGYQGFDSYPYVNIYFIYLCCGWIIQNHSSCISRWPLLTNVIGVLCWKSSPVPGLVNIQTAIKWKISPFYSWVNPLFRLGHFP